MKQPNEQHERLARIEKWAGMAIQGVVAQPEYLGTPEQLAEIAFEQAEAMEAEYQKRYVNKEDKF